MATGLCLLILGLTVTYLAATLIRNRWNHYARQPLPPGPTGLPLLGNLNDLPKPGAFEAHHWLEHKKQYGPISSVTVLGQSIIIINDARLAFELFEKRSAKYSSRPKQVFASELVGWENTIGLSPYNRRFRTMRKNLARLIGSQAAVAQFGDLQTAEVGHFLLHLLRSPDNLLGHIRKAVGTIVLKIAYGYTAESHRDDVLIDMVGEAMEKFGRAAVPGAFMVDLFPFLKEIPDWVPGTAWKRTARQWAAELVGVTDIPYQFVKHRMAQGRHEASFLSRLIEANGDSDPEVSHTNKWSAMSLYSAGADTTVSAIATFYLAMMLHPEVQRRGQEEIDRVVGAYRLPTLADRENLPYVDAIVKETLRWHPVAPMGLPHQSTEDDVCGDYFIPKGSMLFANVWHFTHDPDVHPNPDSFEPERFLPADGHEPEPDPHKFVFGFGRRICPGNLLADGTLFLVVAQSLAVFNVSRPSDEVDTEWKPEFLAGVVSHPQPFKTSIKPRSPHHEQLIRSLEEIYPWQQSDWKALEQIPLCNQLSGLA
ncbi:putative cytochrome P450 oxidoreductase OrdA-like protein [Xylaria palmicola]|nr:putative cytochrome P450 oxidoreductase OrdA-like protein [Xylaria palmicola]